MGFIMTSVTAIVMIDENGDEGIPSVRVNGKELPLIAADFARLKSYVIPLAERVKKSSGQDYKVMQFSCGEDITEEARKMAEDFENGTENHPTTT